jgi:stage II sporulation protein M
MYFGIVPGPRDFLRYVHGLRYFLLAIISIFVLCIILGYAIATLEPSMTDKLLSGLEQKAADLSSLSPLGMAWGIFVNNASGCLLAIALGLILGIYPAFFIASNGVIIGAALSMVIVKYGAVVGILVFIIGLLPHGIFELSAVFISAAMGIKLAYDLIRSVIKSDLNIIKNSVWEALQMYLFWILPILLVAAFIEVFVTGTILSFMTQK